MSEQVAVMCPHCGVPMAEKEGSDDVRQCQLCQFEIVLQRWGSKEAKDAVSLDRIKVAVEKAGEILRSPLDRKVKLDLTIGGEWAKRFMSLQTLAEAIDVQRARMVADIVKAGVSMLWSHFDALYRFREQAEASIDSGVLSKETLDSLFRDMASQWSREKLDEDWRVNE